MKAAFDAVTQHVALHGTMPSRSVLAAALAINKSAADRLIVGLIKRGALFADADTGALAGFGAGAGVAVMLPPHIASSLAAFCIEHGEGMFAVAADAVTLHLDQCRERIADEQTA